MSAWSELFDLAKKIRDADFQGPWYVKRDPWVTRRLILLKHRGFLNRRKLRKNPNA